MAGVFDRAVGGLAGKLREVRTKAHDAQREGVMLGLQHVLGVSNEQVPHEEGDLMRDGAASIEAERARGAISYGRDPEVAKYAVVQHEDLTLEHDGGRNAKFLENAMNSERAAVLEIVGQAVRSKMGG